MWVKEFGVENIKCFDRQVIKLGEKSKPFPWVTFLGENGTGKSTALQAMALLLAGAEGASQLIKPIGWLKEEKKAGKITIRIHQGKNDPGQYGGEKKERKEFQYTFYITGSEKIYINNKLFTEPVITEDTKNTNITWLRENALLPKGKGWFAAGYGAFRRLTRNNRIIVPSLKRPLRSTNFLSQFIEDEPLEAFETWLVYLDYRISKGGDSVAERHKSIGVKAIDQLLPEGNKFDHIDVDGRIWYKTGDSIVSTISLSDGFRSVMALAGDLVWRLIESFPDSEHPLEEEGVVLIDELDIHLHPTWQRKIAGLLRTTFPNIQFIMATHSPLVAAGAGQDAVTYRFTRQKSVIEIERVKNIHAMSVDNILQSEAFGMISPYSPETEMRIQRYYVLKNKKTLSAEENKELQLSIPFVENAIGYKANPKSEADEISDYIKKHYK
jgi:predicted ATPase